MVFRHMLFEKCQLMLKIMYTIMMEGRFMPLPTVFQLYKDDGKVLMKDIVQKNTFYEFNPQSGNVKLGVLSTWPHRCF